MRVQLFVGGYGKQSFVSRGLDNCGKGFEIINTLALFKSPFYLSGFMPFDLSVNITLPLKCPFSGQDMLMCRPVN